LLKYEIYVYRHLQNNPQKSTRTNEHWVPNHFVPVLPIDNTRITFFWTNTRTNEHWVPNHFVPVLPVNNTRITLNGKSNEKKNGKLDEIEHDVTKESGKVIQDTEEDNMEVGDDEKRGNGSCQ